MEKTLKRKNMKKIILSFAFCLGWTTAVHAFDARAFLNEILAISSGSNTVSGVNAVNEKISSQLQSLGFKIEMIPNPNDTKLAPLLVATLPGEKPNHITFIMHSDTVFESSVVQSKEEGGKLFAPGAIDDKGSVVVVLQGLADYLKTHKKPLYSFRVLVSPTEETGSSGFLKNFADYSQDTFMVLGFEPALENGSIVESRRGDRWYKIMVQGKEAHAGRAHKQGINACHELAMKITQIQNLTDYTKNVTVSIGHIEGGKDKFNIVCGNAIAKVDTRFSDLKSRDELHSQIETILKTPTVESFETHEKAQITYSLEDDCPPFATTPESKPYLENYKAILSKIEGKPVLSEASGGAADSNYFSRPGIIILDGLGAVGANMHKEDEFLLLSSLKTRSQALTEFLLGLK